MPCDYCGKGNLDIPTGYDTEYQTLNEPKPITITAVHTETTSEGEKIEYRSGCFVYHEDTLFETKDEAIVKGEELKKDAEEAEKARKDYLKHKTSKSFAWNAGYHLRAAKRSERDVEYHREKAKLCKERSRKETS